MADQNFRVKKGIEVGIGGTVLTSLANGNIGIGTTNPTSKLHVVGDGNFTGIITANKFSGDGSLLTNLPSSGGSSQWVTTSVGIHTLSNIGIGTTNPTTRVTIDGKTGISFVDTNVRIGDVSTGSSITSGTHNNFIGAGAGRSTTSGTNNNFFGIYAGYTNTTGSYNNFFGYSAGCSNTTGVFNNFFGYLAGYTNTTGCNNNFSGHRAGNYNTTGSDNIFLGRYAGCTNVTGSQNVVIGPTQNTPITSGNNQLVIGAGNTSWIVGNSSYNIGIGTTNPTTRLQIDGTVTATAFVGDGSLLTNLPSSGGGNSSSQWVTTSVGIHTLSNIGIGTTNPTTRVTIDGKTGISFVDTNVRIGDVSTGSSITSGTHNNFIGAGAGRSTTSGTNNNFFGRYAGQCNTTGGWNNFFGSCAGRNNTTGVGNNFFGSGAGRNNTTGRHNNFFGCAAGSLNTTGGHNNFFGSFAGYYNTTGCYNNFFGKNAGQCNTTGCYNNFFGSCAGDHNTTGYYNNFLGLLAGSYNTTGSNNNFFGNCAGYYNTTGFNNNFFGRYAGRSNTTGCYNNFFGSGAGRNNTTGINNIAIGQNSGTTGLTPSGLINLTTGSNCIIMGNANHTTACIQIAWGVASDIRYKHVFGGVPHGRDFLRGINPIKYSFKNEETGEIKDDRIRYGFSAQEILKLESNEGVIVNTSNPNHLGITHDYLLPVLVNAIKELDLENEYLKKEMLDIKESISKIGICSG